MQFLSIGGHKPIHIVDSDRPTSHRWALTFCGTCGPKSRMGSMNEVRDLVSGSRLCKKCRVSYLKRHTEESLFLELI